MKEIIKISFATAQDNFDEVLELGGLKARVRRFGIGYDAELAYELVKKLRHECDIIAVSGLPQDIRIKNNHYSHEIIRNIRRLADGIPVYDGHSLRKIATPWAIKKHLDVDKRFLFKKKIAFYLGLIQWPYLSFFEEQDAELIFGDLFFTTKIPLPIIGTNALGNFLKLNSQRLTQYDIKERGLKDFNFGRLAQRGMKPFTDADIFVINEAQLKYTKLGDLKGKIVIIDQLNPQNEAKIFESGAEQILNLFPLDWIGEKFSASIIESLLASTRDDLILNDEDILEFIEKINFAPKLITNPKTKNQVDRFAFVIHPLTKNQIALLPGMKQLQGTKFLDPVEKIAARIPGFAYTTISGIRSEATGKEVEGHLYLILNTPKMLLNSPVERVYKSLVDICHKAKSDGAKIIGLGAYTKIVGDAGVTVNERSPIPLTTGNSLSSASTLWAASFGVEKMGLVQKEDGIYQGTCMVIGATGSIGKICAKILSKQWKRIVVVAPRPYKILELVEQLKAFAPSTEVIGTTNPNKYSSEVDLMITSTSAQGERVLDIDLIKPGCVICDVSRPFDISLDDAAKRPDVLIIASGEVELPGEVKLGRTIGLQGDTVYACLAETAVLAMEGIHESFSLSRDLSYEKVVQIDRLSRKHGIKLSGIMGHTGEIKENEIDLCRKLAQKKLSEKV